ncbi:unnamed protein product [Somion occarium]|uniref:Tyr recombinase domain-containing protein n=1 Tax=Somion occarium TaxID=3059160 RepID=A0ABP1CP51_9APHY
MKALYTYNLSYPKGDLEPVSHQELEDNPENWGGYRIRVMLQTCYVIAMLCLLRFDEALTTTWDMVHFEKWEGGFRVRLDLVMRKTHQYGGIAPFYLYPNHEKPWMCPCQMLALWWKMMRDLGVDVREKGTFIFRKKIGKDRISSKAEDGMSSASFLTCFHHNLCDIDIDPAMYGTHSFRRGGCQYLAIELRWPLRHICTWGRWAENFDNPGTIFKYLLSWVDTPMLDRSDYMNPLRAPAAQCSTCGRTCYCA